MLYIYNIFPNFAVHLKDLKACLQAAYPVGMPSCGIFFIFFEKKVSNNFVISRNCYIFAVSN